MQTDETPRYLVPHTALDSLRAKVAKLAKKAAKLGVVNCDISIGEHVATERDCGRFYRLHEVWVTGTVPRVATGHDFIAKLHHMGGTAIVMQPAGAVAMPVHYRTRGSFCDHCNTKRPRHDTFVLRSASGEHVQVGVRASPTSCRRATRRRSLRSRPTSIPHGRNAPRKARGARRAAKAT